MYKMVLQQLETLGRLQVVTILDGEKKGKKIVHPISKDREVLSVGIQILENQKVYVENLAKQPHLVVLGGGHVSLSVCKLAKTLGFYVTVIDNRCEFANKERFPMVDQCICQEFEPAIDSIENSFNTYYVIVTRGHKDDSICAMKCLEKNYSYIGMIGSRGKVATTKKKLVELGVKEELLHPDVFHAPIGLNIYAQTPEEIAVSIMGQIIQVKNVKKESPFDLEIQKCIENGEEGVLVTIIEKSGSSPRGVGSRMFVFPDKRIVGTIGGGAVEGHAILEAASFFNTDEKILVKEYVLNDNHSASIGMICGGRNTVMFEKINNKNIEI